MKNIYRFISFVWYTFLLALALISPVYTIIRIFENSYFNTLSELKTLDFSQIFIGLTWLVILMFYLWASAFIIEIYVEEHFPRKTRAMYTIFQKLNGFTIPFFITTWALLSLRENHFNYLATILATAALLNETKAKNRVKIFPTNEDGFSIARKGQKYYILQSKSKRRLYKIKRINQVKE
ncbi:TPA: hypothetical protein ACHVA0_000712 [Streptococcus suis]